jgi:hypothetical protein
MKNKLTWISIGVLAFTILYLLSTYNSLFERRTAYLFDPETDDVFKIEMAPYLSEYNKWEAFVPFKSLHFTMPDYVRYVGKLHKMLAESKADYDLLSTDIEGWKKKTDQELEDWKKEKDQELRNMRSDLSKKSAGPMGFELWDVSLFPRKNQNVNAYMTETLRSMFKDQAISTRTIQLVDAAVTNRITYLNNHTEELVSTKVIHCALLFEESAATILAQEGI